MAYPDRRMELPPLQEGQSFTWPDVTPATIPFKQRSKRFDLLRELEVTLQVSGPDRVAQVIKTSTIGLHTWKEEIDEVQRGRFTDRYPIQS